MNKNIKNIVFDLGGVLMNFDFEGAATMFQQMGLAPEGADKTNAQLGQFGRQAAELINSFINGFIDTKQFASLLQPHCKVNLSVDEISHQLESLDGDIPHNRLAMLKKLRETHKVILLSNINQPMWEKTLSILKREGFDCKDCFDNVFLSYKLKMAKPDPAIYRKMIDDCNIAAQETIYFDDLPENIETGTKIGLVSSLVEQNRLEQNPDFINLVKQTVSKS